VSDDPDGDRGPDGDRESERTRPTLNTAVQRRRADADFFLRVRDAMWQNHRALKRLGK
jgi:hypothetical protein